MGAAERIEWQREYPALLRSEHPCDTVGDGRETLLWWSQHPVLLWSEHPCDAIWDEVEPEICQSPANDSARLFLPLSGTKNRRRLVLRSKTAAAGSEKAVTSPATDQTSCTEEGSAQTPDIFPLARAVMAEGSEAGARALDEEARPERRTRQGEAQPAQAQGAPPHLTVVSHRRAEQAGGWGLTLYMAKGDKKAGGITKGDMKAYKDLNTEAGASGSTDKGAVRGPEVRRLRSANSSTCHSVRLLRGGELHPPGATPHPFTVGGQPLRAPSLSPDCGSVCCCCGGQSPQCGAPSPGCAPLIPLVWSNIRGGYTHRTWGMWGRTRGTWVSHQRDQASHLGSLHIALRGWGTALGVRGVAPPTPGKKPRDASCAGPIAGLGEVW